MGVSEGWWVFFAAVFFIFFLRFVLHFASLLYSLAACGPFFVLNILFLPIKKKKKKKFLFMVLSKIKTLADFILGEVVLVFPLSLDCLLGVRLNSHNVPHRLGMGRLMSIEAWITSNWYKAFLGERLWVHIQILTMSHIG